MAIYLDSAATTHLDDKVMAAMTDCMKANYGNPSATHAFGRKAKNKLETYRKEIANHFGALPSEIIFTSCGTESDNMTINCAINDLGVTRIISSEIEHKAVLTTVKVLAKEEIAIDYVRVNELGEVDLNHLEELLSSSDKKTLVTLMHANNEIGTLLPMKKVGDLCKNYEAYFHSDTVQTVGHFPLNFEELGVHFAACSAHKIHGPQGVGFLYLNKKIGLKSMLIGGGQERGLRAGTENMIGITGLHKALEICYEDLEKDKQIISEVRDYMKGKLISEFGNQIRFNGSTTDYLYTVLSVSFPNNESNGMLTFKLDMKGIAVSGGSACNSGANQGSHVIRGIYENASDYVPIRFSFSKYSTKEEVDTCMESLKELVEINVEA
ncbi:MAG: cysteine desulfurase family protein [Flavobacteriales bacterium]